MFCDKWWRTTLFKYRRIDPITNCWNWTGSKTLDNYGLVGYDGKICRVHRVAATIYHNFDFNSRGLVCHTCDNPKCFNPEHLFIGTDLSNSQDKFRKGRFKPNTGEKHGRAKLTTEQVKDIRENYKGWSQERIAQKFGVSQVLVSKIRRKTLWKC